MKTNQTLKTDLKASQYALSIIESASYGKVHSVFENGLNVKINNKLLFIGRANNSLAAMGVHFSNDEAFEALRDNAFSNMRISFKDKQWIAYTHSSPLTLEIAQTKEVDLTLPEDYNLTADEASMVLDAAEKVNAFEQSGFANVEELNTRYKKLIEGSLSLEEFSYQAIGLGPGLTPSGDDFNQAIMMMELVLEDSYKMNDMIKKALEERQSTDVSMAYYHALFNHTVNELPLELFEVIKTHDDKKIAQHLKKMQAYGATSGNDVIIGIYTYLKCMREEK